MSEIFSESTRRHFPNNAPVKFCNERSGCGFQYVVNIGTVTFALFGGV